MDNSGNIRNKKTGRLLKIQLSNSDIIYVDYVKMEDVKQ